MISLINLRIDGFRQVCYLIMVLLQSSSANHFDGSDVWFNMELLFCTTTWEK